MQKMTTKIIASIILIAGVLILSGCGCQKEASRKYDLALEVWGPLDSRESLADSIKNFRAINPNISKIEYKRIPVETYKKELTDALASGQGPDIFMIHNDWLPSFSNKIVPAPEAQGIIRLINEQKLRESFVDTVADDFLDQGRVWAVPLSVDSLGLFYNKDLFNQAGIVAPPKNWNEFIQDVRRLKEVNAAGEITRAGAAIGTAYNINRSTDILSLIMLQNNTEMADKDGRPTFDKTVSLEGKSFSPGEAALNFYTEFANSGSLKYTWNPSEYLHNSLDAFSEGSVAMMFNYSWHRKTIADKAPKLNFDVASVPQFENSSKVNLANYWGYAVAKNKIVDSSSRQTASVSNEIRIAEAWQFLTYLTTKPDSELLANTKTGVGKQADLNFDPAKNYLEKSGEPAARRDLIEMQKSDPRIGVFAADNLIAKSWKRVDPDSLEVIFAEMINRVNRGEATVTEAIRTASQRAARLTTQ